MTNVTQKSQSHLDGDQVLKSAFNKEDSSLSTSTFLTAKPGRKIEQLISTTTITDDTETFTYSENGTTLYVMRIIYTDGSRETFLSAERIS